jgi:hypothetical protein
MSLNPLNDISKIYLEQVAESAVPGKPAERLGAVTAIPKSEQDAARERIIAKTKAKREKMKTDISNSYKPEGELVDEATPGRGGGSGAHPRKAMSKPQNSETEEKPKPYISLSARKRAAGLPEEAKPNDGNLANNYPPYDRVTRGDVIAGATGNDQMGGKKKKKIKEGFSNWRQDLSEVIGDIETERQIKEKKNIKNKVKTSAMGGGIKLGEAIEEIGGTILEMVEIDDIELIEKAESEQQQKLFGLALSVKRGQTSRSEASPEVLKIVDSMSEKKIRDFAKTKHEGIPKKVEEELQPTTPSQFAAQRQLAMAQKKLTAADQIALQKKKKDMQQAEEEFVSNETEMIDERRKEDKVAGTPRKPRDLAFELVAKSMGTGRMGVKSRGVKKVPGKKPLAAGKYGSERRSPAQQVAINRAAAQRAQDNMSSRFD